MRQLQLFRTSELAVMRDRSASRHYSAERDEFRRRHERHRAWGLARRHAEKLRRIQASRAAGSGSCIEPNRQADEQAKSSPMEVVPAVDSDRSPCSQAPTDREDVGGVSSPIGPGEHPTGHPEPSAETDTSHADSGTVPPVVTFARKASNRRRDTLKKCFQSRRRFSPIANSGGPMLRRLVMEGGAVCRGGNAFYVPP